MKQILSKWYFAIGPILIALLMIAGFKDSEIDEIIDYSGYQDPETVLIPEDEQDASVSEAPTVEKDIETVGDKYKIIQVVDGDTIRIEFGGKVESVRIIGMDTPEVVDPREPVQCFGREASNKAKELLSGQTITLVTSETQGVRDKYRRLLGYITMPDGRDFGEVMISSGYAYEYTYNSAYEKQSVYKKAQAEAKENARGLWSPNTCSGSRDF